MTPEAEAAQNGDGSSRGPPAGVKVTPIPPPPIPYPFATPTQAPATAKASPTPPPQIPASTAPATAISAVPVPATTTPTPIPAPSSAPVPARNSSPASIPQKRALADEGHTPAVRSPLNPDARPTAKAAAQDEVPNVAAREKRTKKDSLKKRESKAAHVPGTEASRSTPEPKRKETGVGGGGGGGGGGSGAGSVGTNDGSDNNNTAGSASHSSTTNAKPDETLPVRVRLAGPLRPTDFDPPASPVFRSHHTAEIVGGQEMEFFELISEQPINRRGYVYESNIADPRFPAIHYFRQTEPTPHHAHFSFGDAPPSVYFDHTGRHLSGDTGGFRTTRANVAVRQGRWYWECRVTRGIVRDAPPGAPDARGHVRVGWARREASRDAPVGYDAYGYGIRDRKGQRVHMSRPKPCFPDGVDLYEGDVLGLELQLPSEALHRKVVQGTYNPAVDGLQEDGAEADGTGAGPNVVRDRIPFRFQTTKPVFEKFDYAPIKELDDLANPAPTQSLASTLSPASAPASKATLAILPAGGAMEPPNPHHPVPCLRTLPGSYMRVYKNGELQGTPFTNLLAFLPPASSTNSKIQEGARERLDDGTLGYYPAVSVFRGGGVEANFGPNFWYPPPDLAAGPGSNGAGEDTTMADAGDDKPAAAEAAAAEAAAAAAATTSTNPKTPSPTPLTTLRPVSERYEEQIAEDIVYDLVDEVYFWMLDGGKSDAAAAAVAATTASGDASGANVASSSGGSHNNTLAASSAAAAEESHETKDVAMED